MELFDITETVITIFQRLRDLGVAPALVVRFIGLLLQEALDEVLDQSLHLRERIFPHLDSERRQDGAAQLAAHLREQSRNFLHLLVRNLLRLGNVQRNTDLGRYLSEGNVVLVIVLVVIVGLGGSLVNNGVHRHEGAAALASGIGLFRDFALQNAEGLRDRGKLLRAHVRALAPLLGLEFALARE